MYKRQIQVSPNVILFAIDCFSNCNRPLGRKTPFSNAVPSFSFFLLVLLGSRISTQPQIHLYIFQHSNIIGNRISLISKKNIRYEGILYSINEQDATVALQNVVSFGTEGREHDEDASNTVFVAATKDVLHPYLLFRGCDIKDLHVHEQQQPQKEEEIAVPPPPPATKEGEPPLPLPPTQKQQQQSTTTRSSSSSNNQNNNNRSSSGRNQQQPKNAWTGGRGRGSGRNNGSNQQNHRGPRKANAAAVGTGASLLNRRARGTVGSEGGGKDECCFL